MTELVKRNDFDTTNPKRLREDLRRAWEEIYAAIVAAETRSPARWIPVSLPDGGIVQAERDSFIYGGDGTVRPPPSASAAVGDSFVVARTRVAGTILICSDDNTTVQGVVSGESWSGVVGWALFMYAGSEGGWLRQFT